MTDHNLDIIPNAMHGTALELSTFELLEDMITTVALIPKN